MKKLLLSSLLTAGLTQIICAQNTNTYSPQEIVLFTIPHAELKGNSVRIVPAGWSLFGSVTARVEVRNTNGLIVNAENVTIANNVMRIWANRAATNKAMATKDLAVYLAKQVNLTNSPSATDQPIEE